MSQVIAHNHESGSGATELWSDVATLVDVVRWRATHQPHQVAIQWLPDIQKNVAHTVPISWDYATLDGQAQAIARQLQAAQLENQHVLLMYPDGLDFAVAFLGCLYAGVVAVPVPPLRRRQGLSSLQHIVADAQVKCVLTTQQLLPEVQSWLGLQARQHDAEWTAPDCMATDLFGMEPATWQAPTIAKNTVALLQYTSGSTTAPKGVVVDHGNLLHNLHLIYQRFGNTSQSHGVIWLPYYHDMGLIGGILEPLYGGFPVTLMAPSSFLRRPLRWLQAITHFRATASGGPNFAYERCLQKITPEQRQRLDLTSWKVAFTGAEPVRTATLQRFAETFADCGMRSTAFYPCYGLAEATLMVSGGRADAAPVIRTVDRLALAQGKVLAPSTVEAETVHLVSSGSVAEGSRVVIVDPHTLTCCTPEQVGEIWVSGPGVAQGYWQQPEVTAQTFGAYLADGTGPFLRTGDLGVLQEGELLVTGRLKDVLIMRGQNYYPHDIERTVEGSHVALRPGYGAAFSVDVDGEERLVVVQEVQRTAWRGLDTAPVFEAIRAAVSRQHGLQVYAIQLLKTASIPTTSSGKIQRQACRSGYDTQTLTVIGQWQLERPHQPLAEEMPPASPSLSRTEHLLQWLRQYASTALNSRLMDERRSLSPGVVLDFGNQGLLGMQVPAAYGGLEFGHRDMLRVLEQLGAIDPTLALFVGLNNVLGIQPILRSAPAALQEELLPRLATGRELAAFALTEPAAGSHPSSMSASAWAAADGGWRLRGEKIWSGSAAWAGVINVFVQQRDATGKSLGVSGFVVRKGTVGLRQGPEALTMGMRGMVQNTVYLEDVPVYAPQMLGEPGAGMAVAQDAMMYGRLAIAAASVGGMKRCAQLMLRYSSRRAIATGRLLENPLWLTRINGLTASITALERLVDDIARRLDQGANVPQEVYAICKIIAPEFYWRAADTLVQCLGGRGYIETNSAPQILRDARVLRIFEGPTEAMAMFVGARVLYQPAALQAFLTEAVHAPEVAQTLCTAADRILARYTAADSPFAAEPVARRQACLVIGEIAAWGLLLAVLQYAVHTDPAVQRSIEWTRGYFEHHIAQAQRCTPEESIVLSATETAEWIASYEATIGNIEQTLAGEDREVDALLRKDNDRAAVGWQEAIGTFPTSSQPLASSARRQETTAQRQSVASLQQWLSRWLAQRLQLSEAAIDPGKAFADYGVDSVMAVELAQELEALLHLHQPLDATVAWNFPTIEALAGYLAILVPLSEMPSALEGWQNRTGDHAAASAMPLADPARLDDLSDAELAAALAAEIAAAKGRRV